MLVLLNQVPHGLVQLTEVLEEGDEHLEDEFVLVEKELKENQVKQGASGDRYSTVLYSNPLRDLYKPAARSLLYVTCLLLYSRISLYNKSVDQGKPPRTDVSYSLAS